ncbi:MAG: hypothetical protein ACN4GT_13080 [Gammaproteobacteria bacterium]
MNRDAIDWDFLRTGMTLPLIALAVSVVMAIAGVVLQSAAESTRQQSFDELTSLEQESVELRRRRATVESYREAYRQLQEAGFIADENRLEWVRALREGASELGLPYLRYSVDAQRRYNDAAGLTSVLGSRMELQAGLVHELDLLRLIDRLSSAPGVFVVTGCSLRWIGAAIEPSAATTNISADCELEWLTIPSRM